jgi:hypothetical protein
LLASSNHYIEGHAWVSLSPSQQRPSGLFSLKMPGFTSTPVSFQQLYGVKKDLKENLNYSNYLIIEERIDETKALKYLHYVLRTKPISIYKIISPEDSFNVDSSFSRLLDHLRNRNTYGVLLHDKSIIKDAYLVPMKDDYSRVPLFLMNKLLLQTGDISVSLVNEF